MDLEATIPATTCLYISMMAVAAFADRERWREVALECVEHALFVCADRVDALNALAAVENFATQDWRLELLFAKATAVLKVTAYSA